MIIIIPRQSALNEAIAHHLSCRLRFELSLVALGLLDFAVLLA
jgi:hypothetical protein